jgi:hypothetical protein
VVAKYWPLLAETFPDNQFCLMEQGSGLTVGLAHSIPGVFYGEWAELLDEGLDWIVEKGFQDHATGLKPTLVSALYIEIAASHRGRHLSSYMLGVMCELAHTQGFKHVIAPVRPSMKGLYPLIPITDYLKWKRADGLPFDPWLRVHMRAGGEIVRACPRAMTVIGSRRQWAEWTGLDFPGDGTYIIPDGLVPLSVKGDTGEYVEPGIWVLHKLT